MVQLQRHEMEKSRVYEERVLEVEYEVLYPLYFHIWQAATTTYKHLAHLLIGKWSSPYSVDKDWPRCSLGFSLLCNVH